MTDDTDLIASTDEHGRETFTYAKGKAPKTKPRYTTRPLTGAPAETPIAEKATPKPKE